MLDLDLLCPECPLCGAPMRLNVIAPQPDGLERRTFACRPCGHTESYLFDATMLRQKAKPTPTMWPPG